MKNLSTSIPFEWINNELNRSFDPQEFSASHSFEIEFLNTGNKLKEYGYAHPSHIILTEEEEGCKLQLAILNNGTDTTFKKVTIDFSEDLGREIMSKLSIDKSNLDTEYTFQISKVKEDKIEISCKQSLVLEQNQRLIIDFNYVAITDERNTDHALRTFETVVKLYYAKKSLIKFFEISVFKHNKNLKVLNKDVSFDLHSVNISRTKEFVGNNLLLSQDSCLIELDLVIQLEIAMGKALSLSSTESTSFNLQIYTGNNRSAITRQQDGKDIQLQVKRKNIWNSHQSNEQETLEWIIKPKATGVMLDETEPVLFTLNNLISRVSPGIGMIRLDCHGITGYNPAIIYRTIEKVVPKSNIFYFTAEKYELEINDKIKLRWLCVGDKINSNWILSCEEHEDLVYEISNCNEDEFEINLKNGQLFKGFSDSKTFKLEEKVGILNTKRIKIRPKAISLLSFNSTSNYSKFTKKLSFEASFSGYLPKGTKSKLSCTEFPLWNKDFELFELSENLDLNIAFLDTLKVIPNELNFTLELTDEHWKSTKTNKLSCQLKLKKYKLNYFYIKPSLEKSISYTINFSMEFYHFSESELEKLKHKFILEISSSGKNTIQENVDSECIKFKRNSSEVSLIAIEIPIKSELDPVLYNIYEWAVHFKLKSTVPDLSDLNGDYKYEMPYTKIDEYDPESPRFIRISTKVDLQLFRQDHNVTYFIKKVKNVDLASYEKMNHLEKISFLKSRKVTTKPWGYRRLARGENFDKFWKQVHWEVSPKPQKNQFHIEQNIHGNRDSGTVIEYFTFDIEYLKNYGNALFAKYGKNDLERLIILLDRI